MTREQLKESIAVGMVWLSWGASLTPTQVDDKAVAILKLIATSDVLLDLLAQALGMNKTTSYTGPAGIGPGVSLLIAFLMWIAQRYLAKEPTVESLEADIGEYAKL